MAAIAQVKSRRPSLQLPVWKALLLSLPMLLISSFLWVPNLSGAGDSLALIAGIIALLGINTIFFFMLYTGKTDRYRAVMFIIIAIALPMDFIPWMIKTYGSMMLTDEIVYSGGASFCPLTMPMILIPALVKRVIIFPGELLPTMAHGAFSLMFIIWVAASLSVGMGWCSWVCLYGGWDEFFSRLRRKPLIKNIDRRWIYLPFGMLLAIVVLSAITFTPIYCEWFCPFKIATEFQAPVNLLTSIQVGIFVVLFIGLVVVLPILTRRRVQCGLFCPFGALQSFLNKINIFEVRVDLDKCSECKQCLRTCPTFSLDESSLKSGKTLITCTKCSKCIDGCPKGAAYYHIKGTSLKASPQTARILFVYAGFVLMLIFGGEIVNALYRIFKLITTGSML